MGNILLCLFGTVSSGYEKRLKPSYYRIQAVLNNVRYCAYRAFLTLPHVVVSLALGSTAVRLSSPKYSISPI